MITPTLQKKALKYLSQADPVMGKLIAIISPPEWHFSKNYFLSLAESVVSQQLSVKAADTIFGRVKALTNDSELTAETVLRMDSQKMRDAGLSWSKISYVKNLAEYTLVSDKVFEQFTAMSEEEIIAELTKVKGIGRWTVEMFLTFTMGKEDVFSLGDLGIKNAIKKLYGFSEDPSKEEMLAIAEKWRPYRSIASRYLWKSLDMKE